MDRPTHIALIFSVVLGSLVDGQHSAVAAQEEASTVAQEETSVATEQADTSAASSVESADVYTGRNVPRPELTSENVAAFFDAAFNVQRLDHEIAGAVVSVVYQGEVLFKRGYGWADLEDRVSADPDRSLFRIASITKTFVWTGIMQLAEQGRLDLDADVNRYLDFEIPATFDEPIRVWHLLSHTAGFEESWIGWGAPDASDVGELGAKVAELLPARVWPPGEHAAYSNYGAALAGYIVERVSGQPWAEYTVEHILQPLGMSSTNARTVMSTELRERHAKGYRYSGGRFRPTDYQYMQMGPAGQMSSTAADMARFMLAHLGLGAVGEARILQDSTARLMQSPLFDPHPGLPPLLHGFRRTDRNGLVVFGHGGDTNQFHSNMSLLPDIGLGIFVSYNSDPGATARSYVVAAFLDHFFPVEYLRTRPEPFELDLSDYSGVYITLRAPFSTIERLRQLSRGQTLRVEGDELRIGRSRWTATAPDRFTSRYRDEVIVFERDEEGRVTHGLTGSPLSTGRRVGLLEDPRFVVTLLVSSVIICLLAVLTWGYRAFRKAPEEKRLPSRHLWVGWIYALLVGGLLTILPVASGEVVNGIPLWLHSMLLLYNASLVLGLAVVAFGVGQWARGYGTRWNRVGYSLVALTAFFNLWFAWSYNLAGYWF